MKVDYSKRGYQRVLVVDSWWRENRRDSPELFRREFDAALEKLSVMGEMIGQHYVDFQGRPVRYYLLKKTHQHVFYSIDRATDVLTIHSVWGSVRGKGPPLP